MAAKPKRVQARKGRQQPARQSRAQAGRKTAKPQREETGGLEHARQSFMEAMQAAPQAARAGEQARRAFGQTGWTGAAPQVLGWAATAPAKQLESMVAQIWGAAGNGGSSRYMHALAQANVEMVGLLGRRSRAYLDLPAHLAKCRTPQQMWDEQAKFFQEMMHDYQVTNDRMMNTWMEAAAPLISR
ncbi:MAG: hypothetical protein KJZ80_16215 [Hyphomicrobiaceae bacterium]|nr:hypothetical protein [Hyphomicrobiaceae bacterium]